MRRLLTNRRVLISVAVVAALLGIALWPSTVPVDGSAAMRGPLLVTVDEEGVTRVRERFVISAPVAGRVLRIELEPGDRVARGQVVVRIRAEAPPLLDARTRAEAQASVDSARAALGRARAEEQRANAALRQAERELARVRELAQSGAVSQQQVEARESEAQVARESANAATFAARSASSALQGAEARLNPPSTEGSGRIVTVPAPVDGVILKRLRESESVVPAGEPLLEIGDPRRLEIVSDLLSTDAVQIKPGARAIIEQWGGAQALEAKVRRIEPAGFTKISALGVEEQRVNVVLDFVHPTAAWTALGDAYRVEVRVVIWEGSNVLKVPTGALFREGERWAVYVLENGRARRRVLELGHQNGREAEVIAGLDEGSQVILHPPDNLVDGSRVSQREASAS
jgi:HlyD family secretion protein